MGWRFPWVLLLAGSLLHAQSKAPDSTAPQANPAAAAPSAPPFVTCPAGAPLGAVDMQVQAGAEHLPFRTINRLGEGDTVRYSPILRGKEKRPGEVALVLVPQKRLPGQEDILVTDPKPADKPEEWQITQAISLAALVYGPAGLSRRKVAKFLSQDEVLIAQLADYADKTAQAEQLVATLSNRESSAASVNAALSGFASEYGFAVQVDRNAPVSTQAATVFGAMNPQLAAYNPLASSTAQRVGQTASLATMAGTLFFGSPVGLAAGGTAMLLDLRAIAFPDTQFRASFAQALSGSGSQVNLCGQQTALPVHTRAAYIWATRIPNIAAPSVHIGDANYIPAAQKTPLPVEVPEPGWKYLDRARQWTLVSGQQKTVIPVVKLGNQQAIELDLTKAKLAPGDYKLTGSWDWTSLQATGVVHVLPLSDFKQAHLSPASQDRLLAKAGKVPVTLEGCDYEFTTKVELQKLDDEFATPENVRFLLPKGLRKGPQDHMDIQIDTGDLGAGGYKLLIAQQDGKSHAVEFKILPSLPEIANLPILINQGAVTQHFVLKGERLGELSKLEAPGAVLHLNPPSNDQTERSLTVELASPPKSVTALPLKAYVANRNQPISFPDALEITGPLPVIASSKLSRPAGISIAVRSDEFPAGYTLNAMLDVKNIERRSILRLACADGVGQHAALHIGEQSATWNLQQLSQDQLFLAFDTSELPAGCSLQATIDNGRDGTSKPYTLAHILRLPRIDSFAVSGTPPQSGPASYQLSGQNLEMLEKLGWDDSSGLDVSSLPTPLPGPGLKQSIVVNLPNPPAAETCLYVWLRGDKQGRLTTIEAPVLPLVEPPAPVPSSDSQAATGEGNSASVSPTQTVSKAITVTSISAAPAPASAGQAVTFTAVVTVSGPAAGIPTGTVSFIAGDTTLGTGTLDATGKATFITSTLPAGTYNVQAVYGGSPAFAGSTSTTITQAIQ